MMYLGKVTDYLLPVLNAATTTDLLYIFLAYSTYGFGVVNLRNWYTNFRLSAVIADVLILVIGFIITSALYPYIFGKKFNMVYYLALLLGVQIVHDLIFAFLFYGIPKGNSYILDEFKKYGDEIGFKAILGDSSMIVLTFLVSLLYMNLTFEQNIVALVILVYLIPYILYIR